MEAKGGAHAAGQLGHAGRTALDDRFGLWAGAPPLIWGQIGRHGGWGPSGLNLKQMEQPHPTGVP